MSTSPMSNNPDGWDLIDIEPEFELSAGASVEGSVNGENSFQDLVSVDEGNPQDVAAAVLAGTVTEANATASGDTEMDQELSSELLDLKIFVSPDKDFAHIKIVPQAVSPGSSGRKLHMVFCVDVSGSMGTLVESQSFAEDGKTIKKECNGFTILDLVKHSLLTILESCKDPRVAGEGNNQTGSHVGKKQKPIQMTKQEFNTPYLQQLDSTEDEIFLSLVSFSTNAKVVFKKLSPVRDYEIIKSKIDALQPDATTNLWGGIQKAMDLVKEIQEEKQKDIMKENNNNALNDNTVLQKILSELIFNYSSGNLKQNRYWNQYLKPFLAPYHGLLKKDGSANAANISAFDDQNSTDPAALNVIVNATPLFDKKGKQLTPEQIANGEHICFNGGCYDLDLNFNDLDFYEENGLGKGSLLMGLTNDVVPGKDESSSSVAAVGMSAAGMSTKKGNKKKGKSQQNRLGNEDVVDGDVSTASSDTKSPRFSLQDWYSKYGSNRSLGFSQLWSGGKPSSEKSGGKPSSEKSGGKPSSHKVNLQSEILVFTDGQPNVQPANGHVASMTRYAASNSIPPYTIRTYGFGYSLDVKLLDELAIAGHGTYSFIPDAGMVGTIFIHSLASILSAIPAENLQLIMPEQMLVEEENGGGSLALNSIQNAIKDAANAAASANGIPVPVKTFDRVYAKQMQLRGKLFPGALSIHDCGDRIVRLPANRMQLGHSLLEYGQARDMIVTKLENQKEVNTEHLDEIFLKYTDLRTGKEVVIKPTVIQKNSTGSDIAYYDALAHKLHLETVDLLHKMVKSGDKHEFGFEPHQRSYYGRTSTMLLTEELEKKRAEMKEFISKQTVGSNANSNPLFANTTPEEGRQILEDLLGGDILKDCEGQVMEAIETTTAWGKWGEYYLRSLIAAHRNQKKNNFRDFGVQGFGGGGFKQQVDRINDIFDNLEAPKPSGRMHAGANYTHVASMRTYNCAGGPCFGGSSAVTCCSIMNGGNSSTLTKKRCDQLQKGDVVLTGVERKLCQIRCVIKTVANADQMRNEGGLKVVRFYSGIDLSQKDDTQSPDLLSRSISTRCDSMDTLESDMSLPFTITPWHPIKMNDEWVFPAIIAEKMRISSSRSVETFSSTKTANVEISCEPAVYNLVLEELAMDGTQNTDHTILVNGVTTCTLGHGIEGKTQEESAVIGHPYFSDMGRVIGDLRKMQGFERGLVHLEGGNCMKKDPLTGMIQGMCQGRGEQMSIQTVCLDESPMSALNAEHIVMHAHIAPEFAPEYENMSPLQNIGESAADWFRNYKNIRNSNTMQSETQICSDSGQLYDEGNATFRTPSYVRMLNKNLTTLSELLTTTTEEEDPIDKSGMLGMADLIAKHKRNMCDGEMGKTYSSPGSPLKKSNPTILESTPTFGGLGACEIEYVRRNEIEYVRSNQNILVSGTAFGKSSSRTVRKPGGFLKTGGLQTPHFSNVDGITKRKNFSGMCLVK